jgi:hypothetical protein
MARSVSINIHKMALVALRKTNKITGPPRSAASSRVSRFIASTGRSRPRNRRMRALPVGVAHNETRGGFFDGPGRQEAGTKARSNPAWPPPSASVRGATAN